MIDANALGTFKKFCHCGHEGSALCDWKVGERKSGTCDRVVCASHATRVGNGKFLCSEHSRAYEAWKRAHPVPQMDLFSEAT